jgi:peptidoglycan LD-endopeptidase CwlK
MIKRLAVTIILLNLFLTAQLTAQSFAKSESGKVKHPHKQVQDNDTLLIDSDMNFEQAISGINIPANQIKQLELITVYYYGFDDKVHQGQLVVNKSAAKDLIEIFEFILESKFPIERVIPISKYYWSDDNSMNDNNTSCFNYRFVSGTRVLSKHAAGLAIDINPKLNPYVKNEINSPSNSKYDLNIPGTISEDSPLTLEFKKRGWFWGGDWKNLKDYQHFQKNLE